MGELQYRGKCPEDGWIGAWHEHEYQAAADCVNHNADRHNAADLAQVENGFPTDQNPG